MCGECDEKIEQIPRRMKIQKNTPKSHQLSSKPSHHLYSVSNNKNLKGSIFVIAFIVQ